MFEDAPPSAGAVRALAQQLLHWANHLTVQPEIGSAMSEEDRHDLLLNLALVAREVRRLRAGLFPGAPFANPAWDVMLDLFIQEMNGFRTSLDHLSLGGELPAITIYECVDALVGLGLIERTSDRFDHRVFWLSLSVRGRQGMFELLERSAEYARPGPRRAPARDVDATAA